MLTDFRELASSVVTFLREKKWRLVTAESCTGGLVAAAITDIAGASDVLDRGFVTYSNQSKQDMLGVSAETLTKFGAVSEEVVREMAEGAIAHSQADISIAITGIAGPSGGTDEKPVGTVWIACAKKGGETKAVLYHFEGDREAIRAQAVQQALEDCVSF